MSSERVRVLSIDGGGIRAVIPIMVLARIEGITNRPASELFDLMAGTSIGGTLAMALATPDEHGRPRWRAEELLRVVTEHRKAVFHRSAAKRMTALGGVLHEKYPTVGFAALARKLFGDRVLGDVTTNVLVPSYSIEERRPLFFKSGAPEREAGLDVPLRLAAVAAAAAPTFFEPVKLETGGDGEYQALIDGGVFANNPAMCAYAEACRSDPEATMTMLSIGTGALTKRLKYEDAREWGLAHWARPLLEVTFDGVNHAIDYQLRHLLPERHYVRLQPELDERQSHLDDPSDDNMRLLQITGERLIEHHEDEIDRICEQLVA